MSFVSASCKGETCSIKGCAELAAAKVGEEIAHDDPFQARHNLTAYVCAGHFATIMGRAGIELVDVMREQRFTEVPSTSTSLLTTPRYVNDSDRAHAKERHYDCKECGQVFIVTDKDYREQRSESGVYRGFYVCVCGAEKTCALSSSSRLEFYAAKAIAP